MYLQIALVAAAAASALALTRVDQSNLSKSPDPSVLCPHRCLCTRARRCTSKSPSSLPRPRLHPRLGHRRRQQPSRVARTCPVHPRTRSCTRTRPHTACCATAPDPHLHQSSQRTNTTNFLSRTRPWTRRGAQKMPQPETRALAGSYTARVTARRRAYVRTHRSFFSALRSPTRAARCRDAGKSAGSGFCGVWRLLAPPFVCWI